MTGPPGVGTRFSGLAALTARLMLYSLLAIVLMAMDHRGQYVPRLRALAGNAVEPVYHLVDWPLQALRRTFAFFQSTRALLRENEQLGEQLLRQRGDLERLDALQEENRRLRALLDGAAAVRYGYQFARLIAVDLDPFAHKVVIDRGSASGVTPGQAVIDGAGVMGQVEDVHLHYATVRLISDPNHALPVQFNRTGLRTVAFGTGDTARLRLPSVPREADVREGDLLVTSGLGDRFPEGYPVAVIERIDRRAGQTFAVIDARPLAALDRGREVLLITADAPAEGVAETTADAPGEGIAETAPDGPADRAADAAPDAAPDAADTGAVPPEAPSGEPAAAADPARQDAGGEPPAEQP